MKFVEYVNYCHVPLFSTLPATTLLPIIIKPWGLGFCSWYFVSASLSSEGFTHLSHLVDTEGLLSNTRHEAALFAASWGSNQNCWNYLSSLFRTPFWLLSMMKTVGGDASLKLLLPSPLCRLSYSSLLFLKSKSLKHTHDPPEISCWISVFALSIKRSIRVLRNKSVFSCLVFLYNVWWEWLHLFS